MPGLPVVAFRWTDEFQKNHPQLQQRWVQVLLRAKGWIVPNYELPPTLQPTPPPVTLPSLPDESELTVILTSPATLPPRPPP